MELEKAVKELRKLRGANNRNIIGRAIETVLQALKNYKDQELTSDLLDSIPKNKIEDKIKELEENGYWEFLEERDLELTQKILQELLEEK